jgi:Mg2+-importing ATPase
VLLTNLLYDASQVGIPTDHVDEEYLKTPRRWNIENIRRFLLWVGPMSSIFDYATFFLMLYFFKCHLFSQAGTSATDKTYYENLFHTGWFVESILTQTLIVHIIRTNRIPFLQSIASPFMIFTTLIVMAAGAALPYLPVGSYFGFVPLPLSYWWWITGFLLGYAVLTHNVKVWFIRKYGID